MSQQSDTHLIETCLKSEKLFEGNFLHVRRDSVKLPNGRTASREYIVHPGAVVIVPLLEDGRVLLERQYRYPVQRVMTEFPAGKLDPGEDTWACARRELLEETGYTAAQWAYAGVMRLAIAYSTEIIHIYFARGLSAGARQLDPDEILDVHAETVPGFIEACRSGRVTDAKTLACTLWLQNVVSGTWELKWQKAPA